MGMQRVGRVATETAASIRQFRMADVVDSIRVTISRDGVVRTGDLGGASCVLVSSLDAMGATTLLWSGPAGSEIPRHRHSLCSKVILVTAGVLAVTLGTDPPLTMQRGDRLHVPAGVVHSSRILVAAECVLDFRPGLRLELEGDRRWLRSMTSSGSSV